jgi:hypothetical protein
MMYELTLKGWDGSSDSTDHLVKWVKVSSYEVLERWLAVHNLTIWLAEPPEDASELGDCDFDEGLNVAIEDDGEYACAAGDGPEDWIAAARKACGD